MVLPSKQHAIVSPNSGRRHAASARKFSRKLFFHEKNAGNFHVSFLLVGGLFWDRGTARKLLPWFTPLFFKTFLIMKIVAVRASVAFPLRIAVIFQAGADFEIKSAVASYFWSVFWTLFKGYFSLKFRPKCVCLFSFALHFVVLWTFILVSIRDYFFLQAWVSLTKGRLLSFPTSSPCAESGRK